MRAHVIALVDPVARALRQLDATLAAGSLANARAAVQEGARRRAFQRAVDRVIGDVEVRREAV